MESRIRQLQALLKTARVVEGCRRRRHGDDRCHVTLRYEGDDEDDVQASFVGSIEERQATYRWSPERPARPGLLGHGEGDVVDYKAPGGSLRVQIVKVEA